MAGNKYVTSLQEDLFDDHLDGIRKLAQDDENIAKDNFFDILATYDTNMVYKDGSSSNAVKYYALESEITDATPTHANPIVVTVIPSQL